MKRTATTRRTFTVVYQTAADDLAFKRLARLIAHHARWHGLIVTDYSTTPPLPPIGSGRDDGATGPNVGGEAEDTAEGR